MNAPPNRDQILHFVLTDPQAATDLILDLYMTVQKQAEKIAELEERIEELEAQLFYPNPEGSGCTRVQRERIQE
jgi:Zn-finger domain-containing protein